MQNFTYVQTCIFILHQPVTVTAVTFMWWNVFTNVHSLSSESFIYQQMHFISILKNIKIYIKIYIKSYPTFAPSPLKSPSYECTKKFKCPIHSCKGLEL
jgi:hypothetical protein